MVMFTPQQIERLMDALSMTRTTELAIRCGVTDDAVRKWLRGDRKPRGSALVILHQLANEAAEKGRPVLLPA
jgi:DNA-binding transcriptional regulator YiaG